MTGKDDNGVKDDESKDNGNDCVDDRQKQQEK
jgi:hypothetical protein